MKGFNQKNLQASFRNLFISLCDVSFWLRSARADSKLGQLKQEYGIEMAFDLLYKNTPDPWGSALTYYHYQRLKYEKLLSLLSIRHYSSALDIGCGLGVFTRKLSEYSDSVLGVELSQAAVTQARCLSIEYPNVSFKQSNIIGLEQTVSQQFDLIVIADVLYYLSPLSDEVLKSVSEVVEKLLKPNGILLLANHFFFNFDSDSKISRQIHDSFRWARYLKLVREQWQPFYLVSILEKIPEESE